MNRSAFTLVELVVVMMILAVMATIAVPKLASAGLQGRLSGAESRLEYEFRAVAESSVDQGQKHLIEFNVVAHEMRVYKGAVASRGALVKTVSFAEAPYAVRFDSVSISDASPFVTVDAFGIYSATATVTVEANGSSRSVSLTGPTQGFQVIPDPDDAGPVKLLDGLIKGLDIL